MARAAAMKPSFRLCCASTRSGMPRAQSRVQACNRGATSIEILAVNSSPPPPEVRAAIGLHQAGRLAEAEVAYRKILRDHPDQPETLHFLGLLAFQTKRPQEAAELIGRAVTLQPANADWHNNFGTAL